MSVKELLENKLEQWLSYKGQNINETATIYSIILPILNSLGWDIFDLTQIQPEYTVGAEKIDLVLFGDDKSKPEIMIEAKQIDVDLDVNINKGLIDESKYINQAKQLNVPVMLISNGLTTKVYSYYEEINDYIYLPELFIDLYKYNTVIEETLSNLSRNSVVSKKYINYFCNTEYKSKTFNKFTRLFNTENLDLVKLVSQQLNIDDELSIEFFDEYFNNSNTSDFNTNEVVAISENSTSLLGNSSDARRRRKTLSKYISILEYLEKNQFIHYDKLIEMLSNIISTKGNSVFFKAYLGDSNSKKLLIIEDNTNRISINPLIKENYNTLLHLLKT